MSAALDFKAQIETKHFTVPQQEFKTLMLASGVEVGVIDVYIATWDLDEGDDRFVRGAFKNSIAEHRSRDNRQIRLMDGHWNGLIGGFPIESVQEDSKGLRALGHISLEFEQGRKIWALIKQGVLVDMSIGWSAIDWKMEGDIRIIEQALIWEGSVVDEPMNREATILAIKSLNLPVAASEHEWDADKAMDRILQGPFDPRAALIGKRNVCDVIGGVLTVIPEALQEIASETKDPDEICVIEKYLSAANIPSPFDREARQFWGSAAIKEATARELEGIFLGSGRLSKSAAKYLVGKIGPIEPENDFRSIMSQMEADLRGSVLD